MLPLCLLYLGLNFLAKPTYVWVFLPLSEIIVAWYITPAWLHLGKASKIKKNVKLGLLAEVRGGGVQVGFRCPTCY